MREQDGSSKGCCFVRYSLRESALLAIKNLHAQAYILNSEVPLEVRFAEIKKKAANPPTNSSTSAANNAGSATASPGMMVPQQPHQLMSQPQHQYQPNAWNPQSFHQPFNYPPYTGYPAYYAPESYNAYYFNPMMGQAVPNQYGAPLSMVRPPPETGGGIRGSSPQTFSNDYPASQGKSFKQTRPALSQSESVSNKFKQGYPGCTLFVFYIPNNWQDTDLNSLFSAYGNVLGAKIMKDRNSGKSKGFGTT